MRWPDVVWSAPVLRGVDARGRAELEAAGALRAIDDGALVFQPGEPADAFFVVAEGRIGVRAVRRGDVSSSILREIDVGEVFGEDATLRAGGARHGEARALRASRVAVVPVGVFRRALARAGSDETAARHERALRRAATRDLLRATSFGRDVPRADLDVLLDAAEHVFLARGEPLYREGDAPTHAYVVADGMLQIQTEDDGRARVRAYVARGDAVGDAECASGAPRGSSAVASGPAWVVAIARGAFLEVAARHPGLLERIRRVAAEHEDAQAGAARALHTTRHVFNDLYRMQVARSLLVIDDAACVRCGHCAWSCADAHADGVSRLVRRGDKIVTRAAGDPAPLLVPNSCQHCEHPACMLDCPTGAIGRDPRGEVFIREDLCTGCGSCAKACPWENIRIAPRAAERGAGAGAAASAEVAVKCDLCAGASGGPACVAACPTEALLRVNPAEALPEVRAALAPDAPRALSPLVRAARARRAAWPFVAGAVPVALALAALGASRLGAWRAPRAATGALAGALLLALAAYTLVKRARRGALRPWLVAHLALGALALGATALHAGARLPPNVAGALSLAFWSAALTGIYGALAYRVVPRVLARVERTGVLPEDLARRRAELDERTFGELTGKSEVVKALYARLLRPYARAPLGPALLALSGRTLGEEQRALRARADAILDGRAADALAGLDALVRLAVERRALPAQRALHALVRGWLPLHVALSAIALALLAVHVALVARGGAP